MGDRKPMVFWSLDGPGEMPKGAMIELPLRWPDHIKKHVNTIIARQGCAPMAIAIHVDDSGMDYTFSFVWPDDQGSDAG